jgi:hypothetical protein
MLAITPRDSDAERTFIQNFKLSSSPLYFCSCWSVSGIPSPCIFG